MAMISFLVGIAGVGSWRARWAILFFLAHLFCAQGQLLAQNQPASTSDIPVVWEVNWALNPNNNAGVNLPDWERTLGSALITQPPERWLGLPFRHWLATTSGRWKKAVSESQPVPTGSAAPYDPLALEQAEALFRSRMVRMGCLWADAEIQVQFEREHASLYINLIPGMRLKCGAILLDGESSGISAQALADIETRWRQLEGSWLNLDALDRARGESALRLQSEGWYGIMAEHFTLDIDTAGSQTTGKADLTLHIAPRSQGSSMSPHRKAKIASVTMDWQPLELTVLENRLDDGVLWQIPKGRDIRAFKHQLQVAPGDVFNPQQLSTSRQGLRELAILDRVSYTVEPVVDSLMSATRMLDVKYKLQPSPKRLLRVNGAITSRQRAGGEIKLALGNLDFRQRAEQLTLDLQAGLESITPTNPNSSDNPSQSESTWLNSRVLSAELQYSANRLLPFGVDRFPRSNHPESRISLSFRDEKRIEFTRTSVRIGLVEQFIENATTGSKLEIRPFEAAITSSQLSTGFEAELAESGSGILASTFSSRAIFGSGISWWFNPKSPSDKPKWRSHLEMETAGVLFHALDKRAPAETNIALPSFFGLAQTVDVARYTRWVMDLRGDWQIRPRTGLHFRSYLGIVASSIDSSAAPLEKQFYVGGTNSMRGWRALELGPGGSGDDALNLRGDMRLEFNLEARQYLNDWVQLAGFVDIGNVWMTRYEAERPLANFQWSRFVDELGVSAGFGVRLDFGYFLLRCDAARPVRWPNGQPPADPNGTPSTMGRWRIHPAVSLPF